MTTMTNFSTTAERIGKTASEKSAVEAHLRTCRRVRSPPFHRPLVVRRDVERALR